MNWTKSFLVSNYGDRRVSMKATEVSTCYNDSCYVAQFYWDIGCTNVIQPVFLVVYILV